jgi:PAS domain-containing protein
MDTQSEAFYRTLLDAMPLMIFVVDGEWRIHDLNAAAATGFGLEKAASLRQRGGDVLQCLHAQASPAGCGSGPACRACVLRAAVTASVQGHGVTRRRTTANVLYGGRRTPLDLLITASPLPGPDAPRTLLILEDISELATLRDIIPICAHCKRIRDDAAYWQSVEVYFKTYLGVQFSHGICPTCLATLYLEVAAVRAAERQRAEDDGEHARRGGGQAP